jgi:hypothetical protein
MATSFVFLVVYFVIQARGKIQSAQVAFCAKSYVVPTQTHLPHTSNLSLIDRTILSASLSIANLMWSISSKKPWLLGGPTLFFVVSPQTHKHTHKPWPIAAIIPPLSSHSASGCDLCAVPIPIAIVAAVACPPPSLP